MDTAAQASRKSPHEPAFRKPNQTKAARRLREIADGLRADLGREPDTSEAALIAQAASLIHLSEDMSAARLRGEPVNVEQMTKTTGAVTRCINALRGKASGKQRAPAGQPLQDYLNRRPRPDEAA